MTITTDMKPYYDPKSFGPTVCGVDVQVWNEKVGPHLQEVDDAAAEARKMARAEESDRQMAANGTTDLSTIQAVGNRAYSKKFQEMVRHFARGEHATLGLYFPLSSPAANALRARLNTIAERMGYNTAAALLMAIDAGEVALVLLAPEQIMYAVPALEKLHTADEFRNSWAGSLAHSLRQALQRGHEADAAELAEYRDENLPPWALKHPAVVALCERDENFRRAVLGAKNYPYRNALIDQAEGRLG